MPLSFATAHRAGVPAAAAAFDAEPGWDDFVAAHPSGHVLQLEGWGRLKQRGGWQAHQPVLAGADGMFQAGALVLHQRRLGLSLGYVPGGPVVDWSNPADVDGMRAGLLQCARTHGMHVVKIEPELPDLPAHRRQLVRLGFRPSRQTVQPRSTIKVDLAGSDADLLGRMKSKWRYNIRRAQRAGTQVRVGGAADHERFHALMQATGRRQGFAPRSPAYFEAALELLPDHLELLLADVQGETVAAVVLALCGGSAWYLWGASSTRHRHAMPNYALHFAAMQRARAAGAGTYDLGGIPDPLGAVAAAMQEARSQGDWPNSLPVDLARLPQRDMWTVYRLKQGFGGRIERRVGAWDLPVDELVWRGYAMAVNLQDQIQPALSEARRHLRSNLETTGGPRGSQSLGSYSDVADPVAWNQLIIGCRRSGWQQSWQAGEAARQVGWSVRRWMLSLGRGRPDHVVQALLRRLGPSLPVSVAEVRDGPCLDWSGLAETAGVLEYLEHLLTGEDCVGIRISPPVPTNSAVGMSVLSHLEANGWRSVAPGRQGVSTWMSPLGKDKAPLLNSETGTLAPATDAAARAGLAVVASDRVNVRHARFLKDSVRGPGDRAGSEAVLDVLTRMDTQSGPDCNHPEARLFVVENRGHDPVMAVVAVRLGCRASVQRVVHAVQGVNVEQCLLAGRSILAWARSRDCVEVDWGPTLLNAGGSEANGTEWIAEGLGAARFPMAGTWQKWLWKGEWANQVPLPIIERIWPAP